MESYRWPKVFVCIDRYFPMDRWREEEEEEEGCDDQLSAGGQMGRGRGRLRSVRGRLNKADIGGETEV